MDLHKSAKLTPLILGLSAVIYAVVLWPNPLDVASNLAADSPGYLSFHPFRSAGYPLFLDAVRAIFGTWQTAANIQLLLAAAAYFFLCWSIYRAFHAPGAALLLMCLLLANWEIAEMHPAIITESLFTSLLCVMLGAMVFLVTRPAVLSAAVSALACGLAITVRPGGLGFLLVWPILLWFIWGRCAGQRRRLIAAIVVPLLLCATAETAAWRDRHGDGPRPTLGGYHLFGKALMVEAVPLPPDEELARPLRISRQETAAARDFIATAPDWRMRLMLLVRYETEGTWTFSPWDPGLREKIGWATLVAAPAAWGAWAANALHHYAGLWTLYEYMHPADLRRFRAFTDNRWGILRDRKVEAIAPTSSARLMAGYGLSIVFFASLITIGWAVWRRRRNAPGELNDALALAALCGLITHGYYLVTAMFSVAIARHSGAMSPALAVFVVMVGWWLWNRRKNETNIKTSKAP